MEARRQRVSGVERESAFPQSPAAEHDGDPTETPSDRDPVTSIVAVVEGVTRWKGEQSGTVTAEHEQERISSVSCDGGCTRELMGARYRRVDSRSYAEIGFDPVLMLGGRARRMSAAEKQRVRMPLEE